MIEGLGSQLKLDEHQRQPSAQTLYHYGAHRGHWVSPTQSLHCCCAAWLSTNSILEAEVPAIVLSCRQHQQQHCLVLARLHRVVPGRQARRYCVAGEHLTHSTQHMHLWSALFAAHFRSPRLCTCCSCEADTWIRPPHIRLLMAIFVCAAGGLWQRLQVQQRRVAGAAAGEGRARSLGRAPAGHGMTGMAAETWQRKHSQPDRPWLPSASAA